MKKETLETLNKLHAAISQLDTRGEDESINNALAVVWAAIGFTKAGVSFTPDGLLLQAAKDHQEEVI